MPLYQYQCTKCQTVVDHICKYVEKPAFLEHFCNGDGAPEVAEPLIGCPSYFKLSVDAGGRKGYVYNMGGGKKFARSATRERYEHLAGSMGTKEFKKRGRDVTKSVYTKSYERHCKQQGIKERKS